MSASIGLSESRISPAPLSFGDRAMRTLWACTSALLFRRSPKPLHAWRRWLLRRFGATVGASVRIYPTVKIWAPWRLVIRDRAVVGYYVDCYNCATITIEEDAVISQYSLLCGGTHDYRVRDFPLIAKPIVIRRYAWVCADSFVGPGVVIGEGAIVGARSSVFRDVAPWTVVAGNPARFLKKRDRFA